MYVRAYCTLSWGSFWEGIGGIGCPRRQSMLMTRRRSRSGAEVELLSHDSGQKKLSIRSGSCAYGVHYRRYKGLFYTATNHVGNFFILEPIKLFLGPHCGFFFRFLLATALKEHFCTFLRSNGTMLSRARRGGSIPFGVLRKASPRAKQPRRHCEPV